MNLLKLLLKFRQVRNSDQRCSSLILGLIIFVSGLMGQDLKMSSAHADTNLILKPEVPNSVAEPRLLHSFVAHTGIVKSLIFSPDSKILVSGGLDGIRVWDLVQQRPLFFSYQFTVHTQILDFVINLLFMDTINTNNLGILRTHEQVTEKTNHSRHRGHGEVKF